MRKKIIHFIHGLNMGGAETLVKEYALGLDKSKYEVIILCYQHSGSPYEKLLTDAGIKVIYICDMIPFGEKNGVFAKAIKHCLLYLKIRSYLRKENPDILHTHLRVNRYVKFARLPDSVHIIHTVHNEPRILWFNGSGEEDFKAAKWLVKHCHMQFIVLHEKMREEVNQLFSVSNAIILNNGIRFERFEKRRDKSAVKEEFGIPQGAFVVGHVGRFSRQKNQVFLVDVFGEISKRNRNAFLLLVGEGEEEQGIKMLLEKNMLQDKYRILSKREDIPDLLGAMDVFIFPSVYEGLPLALIEAQKAGLPCFVSDCVLQAVKISEQVVFLPLDIGADAWADRICNLERRCISNADIPAEWDMKNVIQKLENIYERAMQM